MADGSDQGTVPWTRLRPAAPRRDDRDDAERIGTGAAAPGSGWGRSAPQHGARPPGAGGTGGNGRRGQAPPGAPGNPWVRRGRRAGIAAGVLLLVIALLPEPVISPFVGRAIERYQSDCVEMTGFEVLDAGQWPAVVRAAAGQVRQVSARADEIVFNGDFPIHDVRFRADEIGVAPLRFGTDHGDAVVRGGESSATVRFGDIERALAGIGVDATLRWDGDRLMADVQVPFLGAVPTAVDWRSVEGDLELTFTALEVVTLPSLRLAFPEPVAFASLGSPAAADAGPGVGADGVRIATTIDGTVDADAWGCDATARSG